MGFYQKFGSELLVNSETFLDQVSARAVGLVSGPLLSASRFLVTWVDGSLAGAGGGSAIKAQLYNANGARLGLEIAVNTTTTGRPFEPVAAALPGGGFVIVWTDYSDGDGSDATIKGRVFSGLGKAVGEEFTVNTATADLQFQPDIASLTSGGFVVTWTDASRGVGGASGDNDGTAIKAQRFDSLGVALGDEILVNSAIASSQDNPAVSGLPDGGFAVTWVDLSRGVGGATGDTSSRAIKAQIFAADGARRGEEILVNTQTNSTQDAPDIARLGADQLIISWRDWGNGLATKTQVLDVAGNKIGEETTALATGQDASLTGQANGHVILTWAEPDAVRARVISANGGIFDEVLANTVTQARSTRPVAASLGSGIAVVWTDNQPGIGGALGDSSQAAIKAQLFSPALDDVVQPPASQGDNLLAGGRGNDTILALGGNDVVNGWLGDDYLDGGAGRDTISYADAAAGVRLTLGVTAAQRTGGGGTDIVLDFEDVEGSAFNDGLTGNAVANGLAGGVGADRLAGLAGDDTIIGGSGNDGLFGGDDHDQLFGGLGNDRLFGDGGDDLLVGGAGADRLSGGEGADVFRLDVGHVSSNGRDAIVDFVSGVDRLEIAVAAFAGLAGLGQGALDAAELRLGPRATSATDRLVYNATTGQLFYDPDGLGGQPQLLIAALNNKPTLQASDIFLI